MENSFRMLPIAKLKKVILMLLIFTSCALTGFAEANETEKETEEKEEVVWQTLEWDEEDPGYVTHYDIEIEVYNPKTSEYSPHLSLKTEDNSTSIKIEPQLSCGVYRYKIISYDLLGFASAESDWNDLVIYKAYEPEVKSVSSNVNLTSTIYLEEYNDGIFNVSGKNLFNLPETGKETSFTKYFLRKKDSKKETGNIVPLILEISPDSKKVRFKLDQEQMDTGFYYFIAKDASGLENEMNSDSAIVIKFKKLVDINVSAGYSVPYILYDDTLPKYMNGKIWPLSLTPKITLVPIKKRWGFLGVGLSGTYTRMSADFGNYSITGNMIQGFGNLVYQKPIYKRISETQRKHIMTFEVHAGGGCVFFKDYIYTFAHNIKSEPLNSTNLAVDAGVAIQYYFFSRLYAELEVNYVNAFSSGMSLGMVTPTVSLGWQF